MGEKYQTRGGKHVFNHVGVKVKHVSFSSLTKLGMRMSEMMTMTTAVTPMHWMVCGTMAKYWSM